MYSPPSVLSSLGFLKQYADWIGLLGTLVIFWSLPNLDLDIARLLYDHQAAAWRYADNELATSAYGIFRYLPYLMVPLLLTGIIATWVKNGLHPGQRPVWVFLLMTLLIGPGLIVHNLFKEGFERPRPKQVQEFGGHSGYSRPLVVSDQCARRCKSFVSGHVALAAYPMVWAWLTGRMLWLWVGIATGLLMTVIRMVQGGHFLSDGLFAMWVCYFTYRLFALWILKSSKIRTSGAER